MRIYELALTSKGHAFALPESASQWGIQEVLGRGHLEPLLTAPADFAKIIASDSAQWRSILAGLNLKQQ